MGKSSKRNPALIPRYIDCIIRQALQEDRVECDITSQILFPQDRRVRAEIITEENGTIAGLEVAQRVFNLLDKKIRFKSLTKDGAPIKKGERVATLEGSLKKILAGERTALNFLMRLSGIATQTRQFVEKIYPYRVKIMDTRKTTPGLRILEKYAVRMGGGLNHRMDLGDGVLVKDNHFRMQDLGYMMHDFKVAIKRIRAQVSRNTEIEVEVKNLKEFREALKAMPDVIMLDNMSIRDIKKVVKIRNKKPETRNQKLEVSGGINLKNVRQIAQTGIERISIGALTHSYKSLNFSLKVI